MRSRSKLSRMVGLAPFLLTAVAGCTVSVQPWTKPSGPPAPDPQAAAATSAFKGPMPTPLPPNPNLPNPYQGYPQNPYGPGLYGPNGAANNESMSQLIKQFNETDDQRKALADQVQTLKKQARERDEHLQHASFEMEDSSKQLKRTREEVRQFTSELDDLRERMRKLEEMRAALKPLIDEIMYHLEHEKEAAKSARAAPAPAPTK